MHEGQGIFYLQLTGTKLENTQGIAATAEYDRISLHSITEVLALSLTIPRVASLLSPTLQSLV